MATVAKREKNSDTNYLTAMADKPPLTSSDGLVGREPDMDDVIEDLRDDVNALCDLANLVDGFTFTYTAPARGNRAKLTITHTSSGKNFIIDASN